MPRLSAAQLLELNILSKEDSGDDTGDDSEYDNVEIEIRNEDGEVVDEEEVEAEIEDIIEKSASKKLRTNSQVLIPVTSSFLINSNVVSNNEKIVIYGGINKKNPKPFEWFSKPNKVFEKNGFKHTRIIPILKDEKEIKVYFKQLISMDMVDKIANYTNKKIKLIDNQFLENENYRVNREKLMSVDVSSDEIYAFIGILLLLGITKKSNESIETLWNVNSLHYASFAAATMSRDRFQLISRYLTFDDLDTRQVRKHFKFHQMQENFEDF